MKRYPYLFIIGILCTVVFVCCKKEETKPATTTTSTGTGTGSGTGTGTGTGPVDTTAPLDPDSINNVIGTYYGSLRVFKFVRNTAGEMLDSSDVTYPSELKISRKEGKTLLWETDGSIFFSMDFRGYETTFSNTKAKQLVVTFQPKKKIVNYHLHTETKDEANGTVTEEGTDGGWGR